MPLSKQSIKDPSKRLMESGLRPTAQRETVYEVLLDKRDHPTADEVFARVKKVTPSISLATVYNCLEALVQHELVRAVNFERSPTRYCPNLLPHAHFHDETGRTLDIKLPSGMLEQLRKLLPQDYAAKHIEINFHGRSTDN
ncbi:MAG: transcriptional repressor [Candidatus Synoicihabitans palmerolidicus]|nr:transcriptional repressor [Candidatus Synoicihabitans palmerolidicus]